MKSLHNKILLVALLTKVTLSQTYQVGTDVKAVFLPQGYVLESLSGFGYSTATTPSISNISSGNPASLLDFKEFSFGLSMQLDSDIKEAWIAQIGHKRISNDLPQSLGIVIPIRSFKIGYSFCQRFNTQLDFGKLEISTVSQPEGTGEFIIPIHKTYVTTNSFLAAFSIIKENVAFAIGLQYSQNKLDHFQEIYRANFTHNDKKDSWAVGLRYDKPPKYQFGIFFEKGLEFKKLTTISYSDVPDSISEIVGNISGSYYVVGNFPSKFHLGFTYRIFSNVQLVGNSKYVFWNDISKSYRDQIEFSGSFVHQFNKMVTYSVGFHRTDRKYNEDPGSMLANPNRLNALYLTGGLVLHFWIVEIELTVADSHLFSSDWRKQTIGKFGFGIYL